MMKLLVLALGVALYGLGYLLFAAPPAPDLSGRAWWGDELARDASHHADLAAVEPLDVRASDEALTALRQKLKATRSLDAGPAKGWEYGVDVTLVDELVAYWRDEFEWREVEAKLTAFPHFTTRIRGLGVHFIHAAAQLPADAAAAGQVDRRVLLLVHGWPGSVFEFHKVLPHLVVPHRQVGSDRLVAFDVIAPSIPGYGWSEAPRRGGFSILEFVPMCAELVRRVFPDRLGGCALPGGTPVELAGGTPPQPCEGYYAQGGDWGSLVVSGLAQHDAAALRGVHVNMLVGDPPPPLGPLAYVIGAVLPWLVLPDPVQRAKIFPIDRFALTTLQETGYMHLQGTKPHSLAVAFNDSPAGLLGYILEKFHGWTVPSDGPTRGVTESFTKDELIGNVMVYWLTGTIGSSCRLYYETLRDPRLLTHVRAQVSVPSGLIDVPQDIFRLPKTWAMYRYTNVLQWSAFEQGGHFTALEVPDAFVADLFSFVAAAEPRWSPGPQK